MPNTLEARLTLLTSRFAAELAREIRANLAGQVAGLLGGSGSDAPKRRGRPPGSGTKTVRALSAPKAKRNYPPHCLKCSKPHGGPRSSFMCADHASTTKGEKKALLAAWKGKQG